MDPDIMGGRGGKGRGQQSRAEKIGPGHPSGISLKCWLFDENPPGPCLHFLCISFAFPLKGDVLYKGFPIIKGFPI